MNLLSKLFGRKKENKHPSKFFPENRLEALLMRASKDRSAQTDFYKELLDTDLFVLIAQQESQLGRLVAEKGDMLSIKGVTHEGKRAIPVFTSERRLREYIQGNETQAKLNGRALFTMIAQSEDEVILNLGSSYGKHFFHNEILALLDGPVFKPIKRKVVPKDTKVLIGTPKEYPQKAVDALAKHFQKYPDVQKAYVAQIHAPDSDEPPHLIFAIQADNMQIIVPDMGIVLEQTLGVNEFADIIQLGEGGVSDYFATQEPFYKREK